MDVSALPVPFVERRSKPRLECSYPAIVQGRGVDGRRFRIGATVTSLSAAGLCLLLKKNGAMGKDLFVVFRLSSTGPLGEGKAPLVAVRGRTVREGEPLEGMSLKGVKIERSRFL